MAIEQNTVAVGFDLGREYSQITLCGQGSPEPMTVVGTAADGSRSYLLPTPEGLFSRIESRESEAVQSLFCWFEQCFSLLKGAGEPKGMTVMVTMYEMKEVWADAIRKALGMLGVLPSGICLQGHLESFYYYVMNQRPELSVYEVALLEYGKDTLTAWELWMERRTRPVLVRTKRSFRLFLDGKARKGRGDAEWGQMRDELLHKNLEKMFENKSFSSAYLVGSEFEKGWMEKSLKFLCRKRHVFQGHNLYTRGACYAAMEACRAERTKGTLYLCEDMVEHNVGMWMDIRGQYGYYPLVNAGVNWYMAEHTCEFLLKGEKRIVLHTRSIQGEDAEYTLELDGLPDRPPRATRLRLTVKFRGTGRCRVTAEDLGMGEWYPSSGRVWEAIFRLGSRGGRH